MREYDITDVPEMAPEVRASLERKARIEKKEARMIAPSDAYIKSKNKKYARRISRQRAQITAYGHNKDGDGLHPPMKK